MNDEMIRLKDAAKILNKSISTITRHIACGDFRSDFYQRYIVVNINDALTYYKARDERKAQGYQRPPNYWREYYKLRRLRGYKK